MSSLGAWNVLYSSAQFHLQKNSPSSAMQRSVFQVQVTLTNPRTLSSAPCPAPSCRVWTHHDASAHTHMQIIQRFRPIQGGTFSFCDWAPGLAAGLPFTGLGSWDWRLMVRQSHVKHKQLQSWVLVWSETSRHMQLETDSRLTCCAWFLELRLLRTDRSCQFTFPLAVLPLFASLFGNLLQSPKNAWTVLHTDIVWEWKQKTHYSTIV